MLLPPSKDQAIARLQLALSQKESPTAPCVVHQTFQLLASKWVLVILLALMQRAHRPTELQRAMPGISSKVLAQCLRELETYGLIERAVFAQVPPRVEYSLTAFGETLCPLVVEMCDWATTWQARLREVATRLAAR